MRSRLARWVRPLAAGAVIGALGAALIWSGPFDMLRLQRERGFDVLTQLRPAASDPKIVVVDIDRKAEGADGTWTWSRAQTAKLVEVLGAAGAAVIGFDLVFSADCEAELPENQALASAVSGAPVVLGFLLSDAATAVPEPAPAIAVRTPVDTPGLWFAGGAEGNCPELEAGAKAAAATSLLGDADAHVRAVPAVVAVGETLFPGLAVGAVRAQASSELVILGGVPAWLRLGQSTLPVDRSANLRFRATGPDEWAARTVSAVDVVAGSVAPERFAGALVLIGSSVARFSSLRPTAASPLQPSVQIHADVATGIVTGFLPFRAADAIGWEALATLGLSLLLALGCVMLRPLWAAGAAAALVIGWGAMTAAVYWSSGLLVDPVLVPATLLLVYAGTSALNFAGIKRAEITLRRRFGQHLPPAIVTRFVENPDLLKLEGEERVVTAMFTDIEGFTATTALAGPRELIAMLDRYFTGVTQLVVASGGIVDKFVGDAVHAVFNAPIDLPDHTDKAIACAQDIQTFAEAFRALPENARFNFGRTRIGIEAGPVVVGDVGAGEKIDYTAHGNAINLAARLEAANKQLGTAICIGPGARALASVQLRSLGEVEIRDFGTLEVFTVPS